MSLLADFVYGLPELFRAELAALGGTGLVATPGCYVTTATLALAPLLGAGLVLFEWVAHNASVGRAISMALHLANTYLLLAAVTMTGWWANQDAHGRAQPLRWRGQGRVVIRDIPAACIVDEFQILPIRYRSAVKIEFLYKNRLGTRILVVQGISLTGMTLRFMTLHTIEKVPRWDQDHIVVIWRR